MPNENPYAPMNCRRCTYYYEERGRIGAIPEYGHCTYVSRNKVPYWVNQGPQLTYADELGCDTWTRNVVEDK